MELRLPSGSRIAALVILLVSGNLLLFSLRYGLFLNDGAPGPGLFPAFITVPLVGLSLSWLITGDRKNVIDKSSYQNEVDHLSEEFEPNLETLQEIDLAGKKRIAWVIFWSVIMFITFERLGAIISLTIYSLGLLYSIAQKKPWRAFPFTLALVLLVVFGAQKIGVILPDPLKVFRIYGGL
jgi:hypothetical protein